MLLSNIPNIPVDIIKSLKISLTSALHLESVVEDCLDISRMENNKFSLNINKFDSRDVVNEVCEIMQYQFE